MAGQAIAASLELRDDDPRSGWLLELRAPATPAGMALARRFEQTVRSDLGRASHWFLQGSDATWKLVEFWTDDQDAILSACLAVAGAVGLDLHCGPGADPRYAGLDAATRG